MNTHTCCVDSSHVHPIGHVFRTASEDVKKMKKKKRGKREKVSFGRRIETSHVVTQGGIGDEVEGSLQEPQDSMKLVVERTSRDLFARKQETCCIKIWGLSESLSTQLD